MTGAARAEGPFDYYSDLHGGGAKVTAASIRGLVNDPAQDAATIHALAGDLDHDTHTTARLVEGQIRHDVAAAPKMAAAHAHRLGANATYAVGVVNLFANHVETFDTAVDRLNSEYNAHLGVCRMAAIEVSAGIAVAPSLQQYVHAAGPLTPSTAGSPLSSLTQSNPQLTVPLRSTFDVAAAMAAYRAHLMPQWRHAHHQLEQHTDEIATMFRQGVSDDRVRDLIDAGALPLSAATVFPGVKLTRADREANYAAALRGITIATGAPATVYAWWNGLSVAQREALVARMPGSIGNLDGVPIVYRDRANRAVLPTELAKLRQERDALLAKYGGQEPPPGQPGQTIVVSTMGGIVETTVPDTTNPDYDRYQKLCGLIAGSEAIQHHLDQKSDPPYYLIGYDPENGNGHAVISRGNPDTSTNVISYVPGTKSNLAGIDGGISRSDIMRTEAARSLAPGESLAAVTWYGYDAPQSIPDAAHIRYADAGRDALTNFQAGLRTTHDGPPAYTLVVGHSYGTTLIGDAATHGTLDADRVALVASPGADADHASDLHLDGAATPGITDRVYATKAAHDPVPLYGAVDHSDATEFPGFSWVEQHINKAIDGHPQGGPFGPDPTDPVFGGNTFTSDPGTGGHWYLGDYSGDVHKQYWGPGNSCLVELGHLAANR